MEKLNEIPGGKKGNEGVRGATSMVEAKFFGAETFEELYGALKLVDMLREPDGKEYDCDDIKKEIDRAREQLKTFNMEERRVVLTREEFKNSAAYPLRNIPEVYGLRDKVSLLLRSQK